MKERIRKLDNRPNAGSKPLRLVAAALILRPAASENAEQALARELDEELGIAAVIGRRIAQIRHRYRNGGAVDLQFFVVDTFTGELDNRIFNALEWSPLSQLPTFDFLAADFNLIRDLAQGKLL